MCIQRALTFVNELFIIYRSIEERICVVASLTIIRFACICDESTTGKKTVLKCKHSDYVLSYMRTFELLFPMAPSEAVEALRVFILLLGFLGEVGKSAHQKVPFHTIC